MLKILIADDDKAERRGIQFLLSKLSLDIETQECCNGEQAVELLEQSQYDLLITDIKMPLMDGLELSRQTHTLSPTTKIIILSAYDDFEFARCAIGYGVCDYLLKPVDPAVFDEVILKAVNSLLKEQAQREQANQAKKKYFHAVHYAKEKILLELISKHRPANEFSEVLTSIGITLCKPSTRLVLVNANHSFWEKNLSDFPFRYSETMYQLSLNQDQLLLFANQLEDDFSESLDILKKWLDENQASPYLVLISTEIFSLEKFFDAYQHLENMIDYVNFSEESKILYADTFEANTQDAPNEILLSNLLSQMDSESFEEMFAQTKSILDLLLQTQPFSAIYTKYYVCEAIKKIIAKAAMQKDAPYIASKYLKKILHSNEPSEIQSAVDMLYEELFPASEPNTSNDRSIIQNLKEWIEKEYMHDITLADAAGKVYLSPSYLSYLFKKETGSSFIQYLTLTRLQKSKELLLSTNRKIVDIAMMVGYTNSSYFALLFKNYFGYSPLKFREIKGVDLEHESV